MKLLKKMCSCGALIEGSMARCRACEDKARQDRAQYQKKYDRVKRDWTYSLYKSNAWKKVRRLVLHRDSYLCQVCLGKGRIRQATTVHHIEELKENYSRRLDKSNLISLCNRHHKEIHDIYNQSEEKKKKEQKKLLNMIK